jgi:hypothetical protein
MSVMVIYKINITGRMLPCRVKDGWQLKTSLSESTMTVGELHMLREHAIRFKLKLEESIHNIDDLLREKP